MSERTIQEFCDRHGACPEGREWALAHCLTMADVWRQAQPLWVLWVATRPGVLTDRELRLFAVWSARQVQHLMTDARSIAALDVAERHARGEATDEELAAAGAAAWAARAAAGEAAGELAGAAARAAEAAWAATDEELAAAGEAAWEAAWAARAAAWEAAGEAAEAAQAKWLRAKTAPNFEAKEDGR